MQHMIAHTGIVVGTFNNASHIEATIQSIRSQSDIGWICVVVDNGSSDDTFARLLHLTRGDGRFSLHAKANEGPGAGRNAGFALLPATVEFVHFLDGDDALHPSFVSLFSGYLRTHPNVGLVGCQFDHIDEHGAFIGHGFRSRIGPTRLGWPHQIPPKTVETPFAALFSATGQGPFAMFRRSVFERTSGYEESFWSHEDSDIFCQMALQASVHFLPDRLYLKRSHSSNLTSSPKADYGRFRHKWDQFESSAQVINERIEAAIRYYYGVHAPLRHLKVSLKAMREFIAGGNPKSLAWSLHLLRMGAIEFLFRTEVRRKLRARRESRRLNVTQ